MESATDIRADINKKYRCVSNTQIHMHNVTVTFHDVTIQAYLANSNFSKEGRTLPLTQVPRPKEDVEKLNWQLSFRTFSLKKVISLGEVGQILI